MGPQKDTQKEGIGKVDLQCMQSFLKTKQNKKLGRIQIRLANRIIRVDTV